MWLAWARVRESSRAQGRRGAARSALAAAAIVDERGTCRDSWPLAADTHAHQLTDPAAQLPSKLGGTAANFVCRGRSMAVRAVRFRFLFLCGRCVFAFGKLLISLNVWFYFYEGLYIFFLRIQIFIKK